MLDKEKMIDDLYDRNLLNDDEEIILSDGFEEALIGLSAGDNKVAIYDFWKALDCLLKSDKTLEFNEALEWLEHYANEKIENIEELTPISVKTL